MEAFEPKWVNSDHINKELTHFGTEPIIGFVLI